MKNLFWMLIVMCFLSFMGVDKPLNVSAAMVSDSGSDDTTATANEMQLGDTISGTITESDDLDYYKFELESAGCVKLNMTSYMKYYCIKIYDADGQEVWWTTENEWTETVGYRKDAYDVYLEKGIYYLQINGYRKSDWDKSTGKYECITAFLSSETNNVESDNSYADANNISLGNSIVGQISENDDYDTYKFELFQAGCVKLNMTSYMKYYCIKIYDVDGQEIWWATENEWTETVGYRKDMYDLYLEKGTYYMQINGYRKSDWDKSTGKYVLKTSFISSNTTFNGDDNSFANAQPISWKTNYIGQISINDDFDTYKFVISTGMEVPVTITSYMKYYCIRLFDVDGKEICYTDNREWNDKVGYRKDVLGVVLSAGTYYMQINGYRKSDWDKSTGKYEFSIGTEVTKVPETDKKQEEEKKSDIKNNTQSNLPSPTVKTSNTIKKPGKVKNISVTKKKKALKLKWKKVSGAAGYQICYSTSSKFTKKTTKVAAGTTITLKKLKARKNYYVKVRAYIMKDGKRVYGKYSSVVKKKTK